MNVIGFNETGSIVVEIDGTTYFVPDDMSNRYRQMIAEWEAEGNTIPPYTLSITNEMVNAERDRRISEGFSFEGNVFDYDEASRQRITGASVMAGFAIANGTGSPGNLYWHGGETPFVWITKDNQTVTMDAQKVFRLGLAAANHESRMIFNARNLKEQPPIPENYTNGMYWR